MSFSSEQAQRIPAHIFDAYLEASRLVFRLRRDLVEIGEERQLSLQRVFENWSGKTPQSFEDRHAQECIAPVREGGDALAMLDTLLEGYIDLWESRVDSHNVAVRTEVVQSLQRELDDFHRGRRRKMSIAGQAMDPIAAAFDDVVDVVTLGNVNIRVDDADHGDVVPVPRPAATQRPEPPDYNRTLAFVEYVRRDAEDPTQGYDDCYDIHPL